MRGTERGFRDLETQAKWTQVPPKLHAKSNAYDRPCNTLRTESFLARVYRYAPLSAYARAVRCPECGFSYLISGCMLLRGYVAVSTGTDNGHGGFASQRKAESTLGAGHPQRKPTRIGRTGLGLRVSYAICLRACYAIPGTEIVLPAYEPAMWCSVLNRAICLRVWVRYFAISC
eukprot:362478-Rhodomonas_salina.2